MVIKWPRVKETVMLQLFSTFIKRELGIEMNTPVASICQFSWIKKYILTILLTLLTILPLLSFFF